MPADRRVPGPLDTDTAPEEVANGRSAFLLNVQLERGYVTTVRGNVAVGAPLALPAGTNLTVGTCVEPDTDGVVWLVWNSQGQHSLARWLPGQASPAVLLSWAGLNLPAVRGTTHLAVLDGLLLYLDAAGESRSVNLARAAAGGYPALSAEPFALHQVKAPPTVGRPTAQRVVGSTGDPRESLRIIQRKAYQFALRWRYADGEVSVLSPYSNWVDVVLDPVLVLTNTISVSLPAAPSGVREVEVLVREPGSLDSWRVADTLRRAGGVLPATYAFYGIVSGGVLTPAEAGKLFESNWPGQAQAVARSRVFKGNFLEGYPTPEPAFTATVVSGASFTETPDTVYRVQVTMADGPDSIYLYQLASGTYPDPASTYYYLIPTDQPDTFQQLGAISSYADAFTTPIPNEADPQNRTVDVLAGQTVRSPYAPVQTLHENSTHRVVVQFYDGLGRPYGCSQPRTVSVPAQNYANPQNRSLAVALTTTGTAALNAEIPAGAYSYSVLVARNDRTSEFRQGRSAEVRAFTGNIRTVSSDGSVKETAGLPGREKPHEKLWVDIGNFPAAGLGYVWAPGDMLRFLEDGQEFPITGQFGDYLEVQWAGYPAGYETRIEIYTPNTVAREVYYERGPRLAVLRDGQGNRSYAQTTVAVEGDCYLALLSFPRLDFANQYEPPDKKRWLPAAAITVEAMVPAYRLTPYTVTTTTVLEGRNPFDVLSGGLVSRLLGVGTNTSADTVRRDSTALRWLDMGWGGRPGAVVPLALQQVRRPTLLRFCGPKAAEGELNGLSSWEALDQKSLPLEAGAIRALRLAAQGQTEGQTLIAVQERGVETVYLGQLPLSAAIAQEQTTLTTQTAAVIGGTNDLRGGFGTRHPGSLVGANGNLWWWDEAHGEVCRYAADGVNPLNTLRQCRALGRELATTYAGAQVVAGYDPQAEEYVLCFGATGSVPARTVRFSERAGGFAGDVGYTPEAVVGASNALYSLPAAGRLRRHTDEAPRLSWDEQPAAPARVAVWANAAAGLSKTWQALVLESGRPLWQLVRATTPEGQATRTPAGRMERLEGKWYGPLLLDMHTPGFTGPDAQRRALYEGEPVQGPVLLATLECADPTPAARLVALTLDFIINSGQTAP